MTRLRARLESIAQHGPCQRLTFNVTGLATFRPGQYLLLHIDDGGGIPFSIASQVDQLPAVEVHFIAVAGSADAARMLRFTHAADAAARGRDCAIEGPSGDCVLAGDDAARPLLFVAAGSGIAQCQSMIRALPVRSLPVHLYWGVRTAGDLYLDSELRALVAGRPFLHYQAVVSDDPAYVGRAGLVADAIVADAIDLRPVTAVLSGSPATVRAIVQTLTAAGLARARIRSDVIAN